MSEPVEVGIFGAGKLGSLLHDCLAGDSRWRCTAFYDEAPGVDTLHGLPVLGPKDLKPGSKLFLAVGDPFVRRSLAGRLAALGVDWLSYIDRRAIVGSGVIVGEGALVFSFAMVASGVTLGEMAYVSAYSHIGTGSCIGAFSSILAGASVGESRIGEGCIIGLKSVCLDGADVGDGAVVAPMALVRKSVPAGALAVGNPARIFQRKEGVSALRTGRPL